MSATTDHEQFLNVSVPQSFQEVVEVTSLVPQEREQQQVDEHYFDGRSNPTFFVDGPARQLFFF